MGRTSCGARSLPTAYAIEHALDPAALETEVEAARAVLFEVREGRVRPGTDDKVLAAWNGLAIEALAEAGRALGEPGFVEAAEHCASFVLERAPGRATAGCSDPGAPDVTDRPGSPTTTR